MLDFKLKRWCKVPPQIFAVSVFFCGPSCVVFSRSSAAIGRIENMEV